MTKREEIEEALLLGVSPRQLFGSGYNPGSIGICVSRLSTARLMKRPRGFVGWLGRVQRLLVLKRDSYTCQRCGARGNGVELQIHHRDHNKRNNRQSNRVAWCKECNFEEGQDYAEAKKLARTENQELQKQKAAGKIVLASEDNMSFQDWQRTAKDVTSFMKELVDSIKCEGSDE